MHPLHRWTHFFIALPRHCGPLYSTYPYAGEGQGLAEPTDRADSMTRGEAGLAAAEHTVTKEISSRYLLRYPQMDLLRLLRGLVTESSNGPPATTTRR